MKGMFIFAIFVAIITLIVFTSIYPAIKESRSDAVTTTKTAFDAPNHKDIPMDELKSALGSYDEEEWMYADKYKMHTITSDKRDYIYVETTDRGYVLCRIHDYNNYSLEEVSPSVIAKLFGCDTFTSNNEDNGAYCRFSSEGIYFTCFYDGNKISESIITYYGGIFDAQSNF